MSEEKSFDGIILDIDGTIWNTTGIVAVAWNKAIDITGFGARKVVAEDLQKEFGKTMDVIASDLWPELSEEKRNILLSNCCTEEQLAIRGNEIDITYEGVAETIREMSGKMNFYVVSNCQDGYIELMLEKTGLTPYIKDFECFGRTGKGKAENIQLLCHRNGLSSAVYVGDTETDAKACLQAKIPFIFASYGFGEVKDTDLWKKINSFREIKELVN